MRSLWLLLLLAGNMALAADYAREKNWAEEVTQGIVVGDPVYLEARKHKFLGLYTQAPEARAAVIIVHGMGVHPDMGLIQVLRTQLPDAGYTTLSVQMPVLASNAKSEEYASTFDEAVERLAAATAFLAGEQYSNIAIVSHSMGSRMVNRYLTRKPDARVEVWVAIGLSELEAPEKIEMPTLDLYAENDLPSVLRGAPARAEALKKVKGSRQQMAPATDHFFNGADDRLVSYTKSFLDRTVGTR